MNLIDKSKSINNFPHFGYWILDKKSALNFQVGDNLKFDPAK